MLPCSKCATSAVRYGAIEALRGVSLSVREGELVALIGSNGAGKSTLPQGARGHSAPVQGSIRLDGEELALEPPTASSPAACPGARGPAAVRGSDRHGQPSARRLPPRSGAGDKRACARTPRNISSSFRSCASGRIFPRAAQRRTAADAGDLARADGLAARSFCSTSLRWGSRRCSCGRSSKSSRICAARDGPSCW